MWHMEMVAPPGYIALLQQQQPLLPTCNDVWQAPGNEAAAAAVVVVVVRRKFMIESNQPVCVFGDADAHA